MRILPPFLPLKARTEDLCHTVDVVGRSYEIGADGLIKSIKIGGEEILASPMRIVMEEAGEKSVFDENYPDNESESFVQRRSDEEIVILGCKQSDRFIIDICNKISYDGHIDVDFKLMPIGRTVAQVFGAVETKPLEFKLDKLWFEIPFKKDIAKLYSMFPNSDMNLSDGTSVKESITTSSGLLPDKNATMPFKSIFWLGNDDKGLGVMAENEKLRQYDDENIATEVIHTDDSVILRIRFLDSQPLSWTAPLEEGRHKYLPITFPFSLMATPVKPFPKNPYIHKAFHLDCGNKVEKGSYDDYLAQDNRYDMLVEMGVDTLFIHEKWNKSQNWFELSEPTAKLLTEIVENCHKRGIKVLAYFGYELSTMIPEWGALCDDTLSGCEGGWWRVPYQRDYKVCQNSQYSDLFVNGVADIMDKFNIDGVYLDGTARPWPCSNVNHGCGWYDAKGELRVSYPLSAIRKTFQNLYREVKKRGGSINVHSSSLINYGAIPYIDQLWLGETLQFEILNGRKVDLSLDYFRVELGGRNSGVPTELIAYPREGVWSFENAIACSLLMGVLPRPNGIGHPIELMSSIWKIIDKFPVEQSGWHPYFKNTAKTSCEKVMVSYYKFTTLSGKDQILAFVVNASPETFENVTISFEEHVTTMINAETNENVTSLSFEPYSYKILYLE